MTFVLLAPMEFVTVIALGLAVSDGVTPQMLLSSSTM